MEYSVYATLFGSASAGMLSRVICHPLDTAKARLQAQTSTTRGTQMYRHTIDVLVKTLRTEGIRGLYKGFNITLWGSAPATCLYLTTYEKSKDLLLHHTKSNGFVTTQPFVAHFVSGLVAEGVSCVLWVPIDVIKERLQVQQRLTVSAATRTGPLTISGPPHPPSLISYRNTTHALRHICQHEGLVGLYKGYGATLLSFGPFSALYFLFYEQLKARAQERLNTVAMLEGPRVLPFGMVMMSSATAGACASFLTNPLDLVKLRLQIQRGATRQVPSPDREGRPYRSVVSGLTHILKTEGLRGWFKGAGARMAFHAPSTALTMSLFERCRGVAADYL